MRSTVKRLGLLVATATVAVLLVMSASGITAPVAMANEVRQTRADVQEAVAVNPVLNFQGRLLDPATGQAKSDGNYVLIFRLYNSATDGTALWTEIKTVTATRGLFNTLLGDTTQLPASLFDGQTLFLGIQVGADPEATPRQRLGYGAYAFHALDADSLGGLTGEEYAKASHSHTGADIIDNSITAVDLTPSLPTAKFISLDPFEALLTGTATFDNGSGPEPGIHLHDDTPGSFYLGFTVPPDYHTGAGISIDMVWHTSAINCNIQFTPNAISVARPGRTHIVGPTPDSGITVVGGTQLQAPGTPNQSSRQVIILAAPDGVTELQAGDAVSFSIYRDGSAASDTCTADQVIQGFLVKYE